MRRFGWMIPCAIPVLFKACSPDSGEPEPSEVIEIGVEFSQARLTIDPTFPDNPALVDIKVAVGVPNAGPDLVATAELTELSLHFGTDRVVPLGGHFENADLSGAASFVPVFVYGADATNAALGDACDAASATVAVTVASEGYGTASATLPAEIVCRPDRRGGELATRALGANPAGMPCAIESDQFKVALGWNDGNVEIEETRYPDEPDSTRRVLITRDSEGRPVDLYTITEGLLTVHTSYTYTGARLTKITRDDYEAVTETDLTWSSDSDVQHDGVRWTLSEDGREVTEVRGDTTRVTTYAEPITLTAYITQGTVENAARYKAESVSLSSATATAETTYVKQNDLIVEESLSSNGTTFVSATWVYACSN